MTYTFRNAKPSDSVGYEKIQHDWVEGTPRIPEKGIYEQSAEERWWADFFKTEMAWVAEKDDRIIEFCARQEG